MTKIKICWLPRYSENKASSRIRAHTLYKTIKTCNLFQDKFEGFLNLDPCKISLNNDILILQKRADQETLDLVRKFKGKLIIYDFDDPFYLKPSNKLFFEKILPFVTFITTDTQERKKHLEILNFKKKIYIIEDCIDYWPEKPLSPTSHDNFVCWFGNKRYIKGIRWQLDCLLKANINTIVISAWNKNTQKKWKSLYKNLTYIKWSVADFIQNLRKAELSIMTHYSKKNYYNYKSNNKMITAITFGLPCIVSHSVSYEKLSKKLDIEYTIAKDSDSFLNILNYLKNIENREKYLKKVQPYIWKKYNRINIAKKLTDLIKQNM